MNEIRVFYKKTGNMKFISHLDMNRLMTRAIKKAGVPVWYTEGFNPHPYMTFSMPLSLGHESYCESFDIRLVEECDLNSLVARFNEVLPNGIEITRIAPAVNKPTDITKAVYKIVFYDADEKFCTKLAAFLGRENIIVEKTGKKGKITQINLAEKILAKDIAEADGNCTLSVALPSGTTENINPALLIAAFSDTMLEMPCYDIIREQLFCGEEEYK